MFALPHGACRAGALALVLPALLASAAPALADDAAPPPPPTLPATGQTPAARQPLQPLADKGVTLQWSYTGEAAGNVTGGLARKSAYTGQVYVGADLDMDRIAGISGATIHVAVTNRHGKSLSGIALGNNTSVQEVWGTQNTHLAILTWEQKLLNDRLVIEAGRSQANIHFLNSPLYCLFQTNSTCGNPTFVFKNSNFTYFPASSWMAQAKLWVAPRWFAHAGVYEVNPDRKRWNDDGFNFSSANRTGVIVPWELGYADDKGETRLPGHYILGGWFDRADYADPLRDDAGGIAILTGRPARTLHGRSGIYARFDQQLTRPDPQSRRGLSIFGVAMTNLSGQVEESRYLDFGIVQTGTFKGRDTDTLGFVINDQRFSDLAMARMRAARLAAGGEDNVHRHEVMMELAYGADVVPGLRISPNVQYVLHPDNTGAPFNPTNTRDALVFGFKFTLDGPTFFGR
ncbi:porin [Novosphingobium sp. 1529]|uniref:carbohydrate porin n=1 Tax=Novosphingobium sp. 1529 TaxID=3156424 RepID=UPI003391F71F